MLMFQIIFFYILSVETENSPLSAEAVTEVPIGIYNMFRNLTHRLICWK